MKKRMVTGMGKLDDAIANTAYVLDCLRCLRNILETGDCNNCRSSSTCNVRPKPGQMVRYNCPFYVKDGDQNG
jgi:hypothetical protein